MFRQKLEEYYFRVLIFYKEYKVSRSEKELKKIKDEVYELRKLNRK